MTTLDGPVRIAFLGAGRVAQHHRQILLSPGVNGFMVTAVCDIDTSKAVDIAGSFDARVFGNMREMLDAGGFDLVLILTPSGNHYADTKAVLDAGYHAVVEKPITLIPEQVEELAALAERHGLMYTVIFQNRLNPAVQLLRRTMEAGRFGKIVTSTIRVRWCRYQEYYEDGWHGTWGMDGGVINQQAIHHVDALNWICGPITRLVASGARRINKPEAEDTLVALLEFESGAVGTIEATTAARPEDFEASLSVVGEKGMAVIGGIALNNVETWAFVEPIVEDETAAAKFSQDVPTGYGLSHGPYLQHIIDSLAVGDISPPILPSDGVGAVELVHALYASWEVGGWIDMADRPRSSLLGSNAHKSNEM